MLLRQTLAYLLPAMTLALKRAEAMYQRQKAAAEAGATTLDEQDQYSVQVSLLGCVCVDKAQHSTWLMLASLSPEGAECF